METPPRACPSGGTVLIAVATVNPAERPDEYRHVTCTHCGHVGTTGPVGARRAASALAARHLTDGYRKPGIDSESWTPTPEEEAAAMKRHTAARRPGGKFYTGPDPELESIALRAVEERRARQRQVTDVLVDALQYVWDSHCGDTRTVPEFLSLAIENGEPVATANFETGNFAWLVADHLLTALDTTPEETTRG